MGYDVVAADKSSWDRKLGFATWEEGIIDKFHNSHNRLAASTKFLCQVDPNYSWSRKNPPSNKQLQDEFERALNRLNHLNEKRGETATRTMALL